MIYNRPGRGVYVTNGEAATITHGSPAYIDGFAGVAVKQKARDWNEAVALAAVIDKKEDFFLVVKDVVEVPVGELEPEELGELLYFDKEGKALTLESKEAKATFGKIVELEGNRGTRAGYVRVDLSLKV
jgi:Uncharacterized conserved protein (DUF2190)